MDTNEDKLLFKVEIFQIIGCAIEVINALGHGIVEKPYENASVVEFGLRQIPFKQQPAFDVFYKDQKVGTFFPDLIVFNSIIVDTKVIDRITDHERGLMLNYLRITNLRVGVILNFKTPQARVVSESSYEFVSIRVDSWLLIR
jgi:GxxExxY protein